MFRTISDGPSARESLLPAEVLRLPGELGVAGGVLVQPDRTTRARTPVAVWNPKIGALKVIGTGIGVLAAYTPPGGQDGQLAWQPVTCGQNRPLKITNTATLATRTVRLSGSARLAGGCPPAWAAWLPDGRHLITGGIQASYVVTAATPSARPLFFMHGTDHDIENRQDINYSAAIVPLRR